MSIDHCQSVTTHQLDAVLPKHLALHWRHVVVVAFFAVAFLLYGYLPVSDVGTWNAVVSGNAEWSADEMLPLSAGMRALESGTVAKRSIHLVHQLGGAEALSLTYAFVQLLTLAFWGATCYRISGRWWSLFAGAPIALASFPFQAGLSGQTLGQLSLAMFAYLVCLHWVSGRSGAGTLRLSQCGLGQRAAIALLFVVWANVDLSVWFGIALLACLVVSRSWETISRRGWKRLALDKEFRSRLWMLELACLATLFTPAGTDLWLSLLWTQGHPIAARFGGVVPVMSSWIGATVFVSWAIGWFINRNRPISATWILPLVAVTIAVAFSSQMVGVFLAIAALAAATAGPRMNADEDTAGTTATSELRSSGPAHFGFSLSCVLLAWIGFCFSPWASMVLGGANRTPTQLMGSQMPIPIPQPLQSRAADGLLFCPVEWSDWVQSQTSVPVFANSQFDRIPATAQRDYRGIYRGESDWKSVADKYGLKAMLVNKQQQQQLMRRIRQAPGPWTIVYEDSQSMLLAVQS